MQTHLGRIEREAERLNDLITQLLSLSYMEITREIRDATTVSLSDLIRDVLPNVQYEASLRGCHITAIMGQNCVVRGDARLLESALENILRNALRYTPENGVIEVDLAETECDLQKIAELSVWDRGPGVPAEELDAILRPFWRADSTAFRWSALQ
jgi:two-component system sensor histidine kinase CpxA